MLTEKDYCDYDTCVALEELGFNQYNSIRYYAGVGGVKLWDFDGEPNYKEGELIALSDMYGIPRDGNEVAAPSLYEAQKWLREEKGVIVEVFVDDDSDNPITYNIYEDGECVCHHHGKYWSVKEWSEALSEGIKEAVKNLKEEVNEET